MFRAALHRTDPKRYIFYTHDAHGEAKARKVLTRLDSRTKEHADKPMAVRSFLRQLRAIKRWGTAPADDMSFITIPTLIVNGDTDDMVPTPNSYDMHERIKDSRLVIYPHAGHGSLPKPRGVHRRGQRFPRGDCFSELRDRDASGDHSHDGSPLDNAPIGRIHSLRDQIRPITDGPFRDLIGPRLALI